MKKHIVIYHANCADGFGAALAAWIKFGNDADYRPMQYGQIKSAEDIAAKFDCGVAEQTVHILDFSLPMEAMHWLIEHAKYVVWLDHHKTAFEMWCTDGEREFFRHQSDWLDITLDNNRSGAMLAWNYYFSGTEVPPLIAMIDDRDRWQFKIEGSRALNAALNLMPKPWSFEDWAELLSHDLHPNAPISIALAAGHTAMRVYEQQINDSLAHAKTVMIPGGPTGLTVNTPTHISEVGNRLAERCGSFGLVWWADGDTARCSLRSIGDYDVSAIAKRFGGGGHRNAAGFSVPVVELMRWLA